MAAGKPAITLEVSMIITSNRTHTMTYTYHDREGRLKKIQIQPGKTEIDEKAWEMVKQAFKDRSPAYFKGMKIKENSK